MSFTVKKIPFLTVFFLLLALLALVFCASLVLGAENLSVSELLDGLKTKDFSSFTFKILLTLRLPRSIIALICGSLLGASGAVFQGFFRNSLADPGLIGVSSGATLGAVLFSIFSLFIPLGAFIGALASVLLVYLIAGGKRTSLESSRLLLSGTALGVFFGAVTTITLLTKDKELYKMYLWTQGSFNGKGWMFVKLLIIPSLLSVFLMLPAAKPLDIISAGEKTAQSLGLNLSRTRILCLFSASLASATAVCAGGTIGFIGLIAPHAVRILYSPSHKKLIPLSMITGSILLLLSDIAARTIASPMELPIGVVTAFIGVPFFIWILLKGSKGGTR